MGDVLEAPAAARSGSRDPAGERIAAASARLVRRRQGIVGLLFSLNGAQQPDTPARAAATTLNVR